MSDTLILDASYNPISILPLSVIGWKQAIRLQFLDKIQVIECYDDWVVRSEKLVVQVPAVAVSREHMRYKKGIKFSRYNLFLRDLFTCAYCEDVFDFDDLTIDHVIPRKLGGKTNFENTVACCRNCNSRKGSKLWTPKRKPFKPDYYKLVANWKTEIPIKIKHESWLQYIGIDISDLDTHNVNKFRSDVLQPKFKFKA